MAAFKITTGQRVTGEQPYLRTSTWQGLSYYADPVMAVLLNAK
jgi:hypothetical protein